MKRLFLISASILLVSTTFAQTQCVSGQVNVTANQVTITSSGDKSVTNETQYIYYCRRHHKKHDQEYAVAGIKDKWPSHPLLLNANKKVSAVPESYNVTLSTPGNVSVCPDSAANVAVTVNVEKVSSYTGNYPGTTADDASYKKVSKHHYKVAARKMRKIERNEEKVAKRTGNTVEAHSNS